jgi:trimethylamine--corrinoid protein Co-methyltransferase
MAGGIDFSPEAMALDTIKRVGPAGQFLTEDHTVRHFRQEFFFPLLSNRASFPVWEARGSRTIDQNAADEARRILKEHQPEPLPAEVEKELCDFMAAAKCRLE